jgi:hypothetical protein
MADSNSSSSIVAIFAIVLMVLIAGFIAFRTGVLGGGNGGNEHKLDVHVGH